MAEAALGGGGQPAVLRTAAPSLPLSAHLPPQSVDQVITSRGLPTGAVPSALESQAGFRLAPFPPPPPRLPRHAHTLRSHSCSLCAHPSPQSLSPSSPTPEPSVHM